MTIQEITSAALSGVAELDLLDPTADCNVSDDGALEITLGAAKPSGEPFALTLKFPVDQVPPAAELTAQFRQMAHDFLYGVG